MTISNMAFVPATGLKDNTYAPTKPLNESALRATVQGISDQLRDYINNELLVNLPIDYAQIADVLVKNNATLFTPTGQYNPATKKYVDDVVAGIVLGQIPDGSLGDVKLSNTAGQIKDVVNTHLADFVRQPAYGVTTGVANTYLITVDPLVTAYVDGLGIVAKINVANTGASTINVNSLGVKSIVDSKGNALTADKLKTTVSLKYNSTTGNFILQGEGSDVLTGNLTAGDLLNGITGYSNDPLTKITGTLALTGNVAVGDVASGKTFYNTDAKTKLTGTRLNIVYTAGDNIVSSSDNVTTESGTTYVKKKEITVKYAGTYRISFDMKAVNGAGGAAYFVLGRVYKNGVAIGTERQSTSSSNAVATYTEDFSLNANDNIQVYSKCNTLNQSSEISNFRIKAAETVPFTVVL